MGVIAGIYLVKGKNQDLEDSLLKMMKIQAHRDSSEPINYIGENFAFGMANRHDFIFRSLDLNNILVSSPLVSGSAINSSGIHAFVDGIVLETPKHKKYFESKNPTFPLSTCSDIVAAAYEKWGLDFMNHLEGEFSCLVWDQKTQSVILARDPYCHKPIHYYFDGSKLLFSSEIKGILAEGSIVPEVDLQSLSDFLSLNSIPNPATIFKDIKQVSPGGMIIVTATGIKEHTYWYPRLCPDESMPLEDAIFQLTGKLRDAVRKRMVNEDTYCFLSGGLDSSAIISLAAELSNKPVHAISVGFEEEEQNELGDAAIMAKHVGAIHHQFVETPDSFFDILDLLVYHHDSPFTDTSAFPTFYAAKLANQLTNLILTGDGPDQTLGGSDHYVFALKHNLFSDRKKVHQMLFKPAAGLARIFNKSPKPSIFSKIERKLYRDSLSLPAHVLYELRSYFPEIVKRFICSEWLWNIHLKKSPYRYPESWFEEAKELDYVNKYLFADIKFYIPDILMIKVDRMCMAHGLETLSPFMDIPLSNFLNKLPGNYKIKVGTNNEVITKYILRKMCEGRFPGHTLTKKKQGFEIPVDKWLRQCGNKYLREILLDHRTLQRCYFKKKSIEQLVNTFIERKGDYFFPNPRGIVGLLTFELWHRKYID